eukprot:scaffold69841_cov22-Prasinocladus_malaysianus.AAC.1
MARTASLTSLLPDGDDSPVTVDTMLFCYVVTLTPGLSHSIVGQLGVKIAHSLLHPFVELRADMCQ